MTKTDRENAAIRAHCEAVGYDFKPWQPVPWETETREPPAWASPGSAWCTEWPRIYKLRLKILEELRGGMSEGGAA